MKRQEPLDEPSLLSSLRAWLLLLVIGVGSVVWVFFAEKLYRRRKWQVFALVLLIVVAWPYFSRQVA
ncbi:MAG: hypothetical protein ACKVIS_08970 [Pseudomonadales bacterium]